MNRPITDLSAVFPATDSVSDALQPQPSRRRNRPSEDVAVRAARITGRRTLLAALIAGLFLVAGAVFTKFWPSPEPDSVRIDLFYDRHEPRCRRLATRAERHSCRDEARKTLGLTAAQTPLVPRRDLRRKTHRPAELVGPKATTVTVSARRQRPSAAIVTRRSALAPV